MTLTSKTHPYKAGFSAFASDVYRIPFLTPIAAKKVPPRKPSRIISRTHSSGSVAPESVAAVIARAGFRRRRLHRPAERLFRAAAKNLPPNMASFIADEVQSGFARTGKWFASEHFGIEPDLIAMANP